MTRVHILPYLDAYWRASEAPDFLGQSDMSTGILHPPVRAGASQPVLRPPPVPDDGPIGAAEMNRLRRLHRYLGRIHRAREACPHAEVLRVIWADWSVTPLCADCGHQGHPMSVPAVADALLIPRDTKEFLALTGLSSVGSELGLI